MAGSLGQVLQHLGCHEILLRVPQGGGQTHPRHRIHPEGSRTNPECHKCLALLRALSFFCGERIALGFFWVKNQVEVLRGGVFQGGLEPIYKSMDFNLFRL